MTIALRFRTLFTVALCALTATSVFSAPAAVGTEKVFPSQVRLKVLKAGTGALPQPDSKIELNYRVFREDGTEADSSARRGGPAKRALKDMMPCFKEALPHVHEGATVALFCPAASLAAPGAPGAALDLNMEVQILKLLP